MGTVEYEGIVLTIPPQVYEPREDSFLLAKNLNVKNGEEVLELGTGSGLLAILATKKGGKVTAVDINPVAVEAAKKNAEQNNVEIDFKEGNLFEPVFGRQFDLIIFNPPYLPPEGEPKELIDLSYHSSEVIKQFMEEYGIYLKRDGRALIVNSSLSGVEVDGKILDRKKIFFEELVVLELR